MGDRQTQLGTFREDSGCDTSQRGVLVSISPEDQWISFPQLGEKGIASECNSLSGHTYRPLEDRSQMKQKQRRGEKASPRRDPGSESWVSWVPFRRMGGPLNHCLWGGWSLKRRTR